MPKRQTYKISHRYQEANQTCAYYREKPEISTGHILYLPHSSEVIEVFSFTIWAGEQAGKDPHLNCHPIKIFWGWFVLQSIGMAKFCLPDITFYMGNFCLQPASVYTVSLIPSSILCKVQILSCLLLLYFSYLLGSVISTR